MAQMRTPNDDALASVAVLHERTARDVARSYARLLLHAYEVIEMLEEGEEHGRATCDLCHRIRAHAEVLRGAVPDLPAMR